jgi:hypothetical protein
MVDHHHDLLVVTFLHNTEETKPLIKLVEIFPPIAPAAAALFCSGAFQHCFSPHIKKAHFLLPL